MVKEKLNIKLGLLYKELWGLYNSGELENINCEEGIILRSLLINLCGNVGDDLNNVVDLECYEYNNNKVNNVYKKYINK